MKRTKRLTKREKKQTAPSGPGHRATGPAQHQHDHAHHLHCIACGKHLDASTFGEAEGSEFIRCEHGSDFPCCVGCHDKAKVLVEEHDRTNQPIRKAAIWH